MDFELQSVLANVATQLKKAGFDSARLEARMLVSYVLGLENQDVFFANLRISSSQKEEIISLLEQRLQHKPICKIIGRKDFYKYVFFVNSDVLSPRPDTETLVEAVVAYAKEFGAKNILDLGTGSGCILLSVLSEFEEMQGIGVDISSEALKVALRNTYQLGLDKKVSFINAGWFDGDFLDKLEDKFDIIVSNPPYIPSEDILSLEEDVKLYDPLLALDGGKDGLRDYRQLAKLAPRLLNEGGAIFLEVGIYQAEVVEAIFQDAGLKHFNTLKDFGGIKRCVIFKK